MALLILVPACGGDEGESGRWVEMLEAIPDTATTRMAASIIDYEAASAALGVERPGPDAIREELGFYWTSLSRSGAAQPLQRVMDPEAVSAEWGYWPQDIDRVASSVGGLWVLEGAFDATAINGAIRSSREGVDGAAVGDYEEHDLHRWATPAHHVDQRGGGLAIVDSRLLRTQEADDLVEMLDSLRGDVPSLADLDDVQALAAALEQPGIYTVTFSIEPSISIAAALAHDDGPVSVLAFAYENQDMAAERRQAIEREIRDGTRDNGGRPFAEIISDFQVSSEGRVVTAVLFSDYPQLAHSTGIVGSIFRVAASDIPE